MIERWEAGTPRPAGAPTKKNPRCYPAGPQFLEMTRELKKPLVGIGRAESGSGPGRKGDRGRFDNMVEGKS